MSQPHRAEEMKTTVQRIDLPILSPFNSTPQSGGCCGSDPVQTPALASQGCCSDPGSTATATLTDASASTATVDSTMNSATPPRQRLPRWLKRRLPMGGNLSYTDKLLTDLKLTTVCEEAKCPNLGECWSRKTATFMVMGDTCTRPCGFCAVKRGKPDALELDEPQRVAEAAARLGLKYVVITSVTRDDLADGGAEHFRQCILAVRERTQARVEVLTPDFDGSETALRTVMSAKPEVFNHNIETVARLQRRVRRKSNYRLSLEVLRLVKQIEPQATTKSGIMLGLGETREEILDTFADLRAAGVDILTVGQYLQPSSKHLPIERFITPEEFTELGQLAERMGFAHVASAPFVRSSYHADEAWLLAANANGTAPEPLADADRNDFETESVQVPSLVMANHHA